MDNFCLVTNKGKDTDLKMTMHIKEYLEAHGKKCVTAQHQPESVQSNQTGREFMSAIPEDSECCIVLGGDGTMLQAARSIAYLDIPIIGVNLGTLGYLTEVEIGNVDEALDRIMAGEYEIENRMMLYGSVNGNHDYALNDIVITKFSAIAAISFDIFVNDLFLCNYHADGIIISTPTGSTGYSMSAGGPIVEPSANMILITPICPHTLNSRSLVLSAETKIRIVICSGKDNRKQRAMASFDGSKMIELATDDEIYIEKANKTTGIMKLNRVSFLQVLGKKFDK